MFKVNETYSQKNSTWSNSKFEKLGGNGQKQKITA